MRRKQKKADDDAVDMSWALSYGDLMTLLLTFFILILSFSSTELIKFRKAMGSLRGSLGVLLEQDGSAVMRTLDESQIPILEKEIMFRMLEDIESQIFKEDEGDQMAVEVLAASVIFRINNDILFNVGDVEPSPATYKILNKIGRVIVLFSCDIRVEGHTDDLPLQTTQFPSNWELSTYRAASVVRYFIRNFKTRPTRFIASGFGQFRPIYPNNTPEHRRKNRRVEIILSWENR